MTPPYHNTQQDLSLLITGLARWELQPSKAFLQDYMDRTLQCLPDFQPQVCPSGQYIHKGSSTAPPAITPSRLTFLPSTMIQGLGHTLRSLASLLQTTAPPAGFMDAFLRRVDETAAAMAYSDAVLIAGGAWKETHVCWLGLNARFGRQTRGFSHIFRSAPSTMICRPLQARPRGLPHIPPGLAPPPHRVRAPLPCAIAKHNYLCLSHHYTLTSDTPHHDSDDDPSGPAARNGSGGRRGKGGGARNGCVELLHANELAVVLNFLTRREGKGPPVPPTLLARLLVRDAGRL